MGGGNVMFTLDLLLIHAATGKKRIFSLEWNTLAWKWRCKGKETSKIKRKCVSTTHILSILKLSKFFLEYKKKIQKYLCLTTLQLFWLQLLGNLSVKSFQRLWYFPSWATEHHKGYGTNVIVLPLSPLVQHSMEHWFFWPWREQYGKEGEVDILIICHKWLGASELYPLSRQCLRVTRILGKRAPVCHKSGYPKGYESFMLFISCMLRRKCSHPTWDPQVPLLSIYFCLIPFKLCTHLARFIIRVLAMPVPLFSIPFYTNVPITLFKRPGHIFKTYNPNK